MSKLQSNRLMRTMKAPVKLSLGGGSMGSHAFSGRAPIRKPCGDDISRDLSDLHTSLSKCYSSKELRRRHENIYSTSIETTSSQLNGTMRALYALDCVMFDWWSGTEQSRSLSLSGESTVTSVLMFVICPAHLTQTDQKDQWLWSPITWLKSIFYQF